MNNVNLGEKPGADNRDQDTTSSRMDGIQVNDLEPGDVLSITTANSIYHLTVVDPETAQVRVRGGNCFGRDTLAEVAGSSLNLSVKPFGIYVGYSIEFFMRGRRVRTSPVRDVRVLEESERVA